MASRPLAGIKVLDLTNVLAGPFACHQLAHFGAEVIKVEAPGRGDLARNLGADPALNAAGMGVSYLAQNAGKKSITLNLKHPEGKTLLARLVADADVLVENYRPGVMDRLGVGYEALKGANPRLVYCAISGFGQEGPWKDRPAYDQIIQGVSGVMSVTGDTDSAPLRVGYPIADTIGGLTAAFAVCAALNAPKRGAFIDVSMMDSVLATMGWVVSNHLTAGVAPMANGNENPTSAPSGTFRTADRPINIAANKDEQWIALTGVIGRADLKDRPEYATRELRKTNRLQLRDDLEETLTTWPSDRICDALNAAGVPAGPVLSVPEALFSDQMVVRDMIARYPDAAGPGRDAVVVRTGAKVNGAPTSVSTPPPALGVDTRDVLGALGLTEAELDRLAAEGVT